MSRDEKPPEWLRKSTTDMGDFAVFSVRRDENVSPRTGRSHAFFVIEAPDWVNVIPVRPDGRIVCIEQYRHGTGEITLEIPGGVVDPGESPLDAARRELREETGLASERWRYLGSVSPNPAIQSNRCHMFVAESVTMAGVQKLDATEDISVIDIEHKRIRALVRDGSIHHSLVVAAFYYFDLDRSDMGGASA